MGLIINADDYGKDTQYTDGIVESFKKGWISRTTLMVNMPDCSRAVDLAKKYGFAGRVGLHLNLIEGVPLTENIRRCPNICDEKGRFLNFLKGRPPFWRALDDTELLAVAEEIDAQVNVFLSYGLVCRHCDGHHHCHCKWAVLPILLPILVKYGFTSIRRPNNIAIRLTRFPHLALRQRWELVRLMSQIQSSRLETTTYMDGFAEWNRAQLLGVMSRSCLDETEIMVHPKLEDGLVVNKYEKNELTMREVYEKLCH